MRVNRSGLGAGAAALALVLTLGGCASTPEEDAVSDIIITVNGSEPQNPLIPTNTNETGGGKILDSIFSGLITYGVDGAPVNEVAESITSDDATTFTITLKDGWTFSNGEPVTSESFVDAWNYGAKLSNEHTSSYFFEDIEGFSWDEDSELTGLRIVDDLTFTVTLSHPAADFPLRLGYSAFYPLPSVAFDDMQAFGENPIGNGPYMLDGDSAWQHNERIDLIVNPDYAGSRTPKNGGVSIVFYASAEAAYADLLGGNLDILDDVPASAIATFEADLGDRTVNQPAAVLQTMTIPERLEHFDGEEGALRRAAISMAINRDEITDVIFDGTRTPARDFSSPVIDGWSDDLAGAEVLDFDPDAARDLWAQADAINPWSGTFQIGYNADASHQGWVDAVANGLKNALGIEAEGAPYPTFAEFRTAVTDRTISSAFRTGWQADYPGLYNFLGPVYGTGAGSNDGDYSSAEFDGLIKDGISEPDDEARKEYFTQAQELLLKDLPLIPLWYANATGGYGTRVSDVTFGWNGVPIYYAVTAAE
jgi:oligopeptide transport system substrate-binding protein